METKPDKLDLLNLTMPCALSLLVPAAVRGWAYQVEGRLWPTDGPALANPAEAVARALRSTVKVERVWRDAARPALPAGSLP